MYCWVFFRLSQGKAIGFRFKDWSDYKIEKQSIAIADGETTEFQLLKSYFCDSYNCTRAINKPVIDTIKIYLNDKLVRAFIDGTTGIVRFQDPPEEGGVIQASGEFDVAVRFDIDHLVTSIENYGVYSHQDIPLIEIKL